jgi:formamidase
MTTRHKHYVAIDRSKSQEDDTGTGHNRWHPDIEPVIEVDPGEEVTLETRDAADGKIGPGFGPEDLPKLGNRSHPLTGPVYVRGATAGDLLEIEFLSIEAEPYGWTGAGFGGALPGMLDAWQCFHWSLGDGCAVSEQLPGVRIPERSFMGTAGVAPSRELLEAWHRREDPHEGTPGAPFPRAKKDAVPADDPIASEGARTIPPRENFGNADVRQLTVGSRLYVPVFVDGAKYSAGDAHFAQGDGETSGTGIEMGATHTVRFTVHKGEAERRGIRWPRFARRGAVGDELAMSSRDFTATVGVPITAEGELVPGDLGLATRNALREMIALLGERGWTPAQAYVICSAAVDLRISNVVNIPDVLVSALLPEDIFT